MIRQEMRCLTGKDGEKICVVVFQEPNRLLWTLVINFVEYGPSILSRPLRQPLPSRQRGCCNLLRNLTDFTEKISASSYSKTFAPLMEKCLAQTGIWIKFGSALQILRYAQGCGPRGIRILIDLLYRYPKIQLKQKIGRSLLTVLLLTV